MLEARNGSGTIKAFPRVGVKGKGPVNRGNTGLQNKTFHCEICDVHVNSETQLKQVGGTHSWRGDGWGPPGPRACPAPFLLSLSLPPLHPLSFWFRPFTCACVSCLKEYWNAAASNILPSLSEVSGSVRVLQMKLGRPGGYSRPLPGLPLERVAFR